ncbi:Uncharacterized protein FWK35_00017396 [Aphis craccivora]|uniref:Uncharacterized protein n=1 Tax=Aphis craccivora TaxID=307492 RepID=A0A6G0XZ37_APHCR|nr:Uncharacterized protein FWK35_00017396 [Aphis craccivora]
MVVVNWKVFSYQPVLQCLRLSTLCDRREQANLTFHSKLLNGDVDFPALLNKLNFRIPSFYSRYSFPFQIPFSRCNYLTNRPIVRMMKLAIEDPLFLTLCYYEFMYTTQYNWARPYI